MQKNLELKTGATQRWAIEKPRISRFMQTLIILLFMSCLTLASDLVHVGHRRKGLGIFILDWMEARARQRLSELTDDKPWGICSKCDGHFHVVNGFLKQFDII